mgnify:CR=1 FL=1
MFDEEGYTNFKNEQALENMSAFQRQQELLFRLKQQETEVELALQARQE